MTTFLKIKKVSFIVVILMGPFLASVVYAADSPKEESDAKKSFNKRNEYMLFRVRVTELVDIDITTNEGSAISKRRNKLMKLFNKVSVKSANTYYSYLTDDAPSYFWVNNFHRKLSSNLRNDLLNIFREKLGIYTVDNSSHKPDEHILFRARVKKLLDVKISANESLAISKRRKELIKLFNKASIKTVNLYYIDLTDENPKYSWIKYFNRKLSSSLRNKLLNIFRKKLGLKIRVFKKTISEHNIVTGTKKIEDTYESIRQIIWNNLHLEDGGWGIELEAKLAERPARLVRVFNRMPKDSTWDFHTELGVEDNGGGFSKLFHGRLSYELRDQLLGILWERSSPSQTQQSSDSNRAVDSKTIDNSYEHIRELIWNNLLLEDSAGSEGVAEAIAERPARLVRVFNRMPKNSAWDFHTELGVEGNGGGFSKLFHGRLSYELRDQLLGILWERSAPSQTQQLSDANRVVGSKEVEGSYEHIRELIWNDLLLAVGNQDTAAMIERGERLEWEFNRVPKDSAWAFYNELGEKNNGGEFSKLFHEKLSYVLKEKLLGILWELSRQ